MPTTDHKPKLDDVYLAHVRVMRPKYFLVDVQSFLVQLLRLIVIALCEVENSQVIGRHCYISMHWAKQVFIDIQRSAIHRNGLIVATQELIATSDVGQ